jgi:hypothetical protein
MAITHGSNFSAPLQQTSPLRKRKQGERSPRFVSPTYWWEILLDENSSVEVLNSPKKDTVAMGRDKPAKKRLRLVPQSPNPPSSAGTKARVDSKCVLFVITISGL